MEKLIQAVRFFVSMCFIASFLASAHAQTLLFSEGFETNGEGSRYTSNTYQVCGGEQDFFIRTNTNPVTPPSCATMFATTLTNLQGSFFWASEDIRSSSPTPNAFPPGDITTQSFSVAGYGSLTVSLYLACSNNGNRWEGADSLNIQVSVNGGPFRTVGRFLGKAMVAARLGIDGNLNGTYDAGTDPATDCDVPNFTRYTFSVPFTGSTMQVKLDFDQVGGSEELAIDQIEVHGTVIVPVKWASFTAHQVNDAVQLDWGTTEEVGVREFQVERLAQEGTFEQIGVVAAAGKPSSYSFVHHQPVTGTNLYRIKQVDADNAFSYSEVVEIQVVDSRATQVYPNPMASSCRVVLAGEPGSGSYSLFDPTGRLLRTVPFSQASELVLERNHLPTGLYHLRLDLAGGRTFTQKLLIRD